MSEKDDLSKDEPHFFLDSYKSTENWGAKEGIYTRRINDRQLAVTVSYRVELV